MATFWYPKSFKLCFSEKILNILAYNTNITIQHV
jgi:hypothetical protein